MEHSLKHKVLKVSRDAVLERQNSSEWLQKVPAFNANLRLTKKDSLKKLFADLEIKGYKAEKKLLDLEVLVANLVLNTSKSKNTIAKVPVRVSLNRMDWQKSRYNDVSYSLLNLIKKMHEKGYIEMKKGFKTKSLARQTRIWATQKLIDSLQLLPENVIYEPKELVELRGKDEKLIEYKDTPKTIRIRGILRRANAVNAQANILHKQQKLNASLVSIFVGNFSLYGRLHTRRYRHYQGLSGEARKEITINGEPVVELDYSALHPNLLYAAKDIQYFGDPYGVIVENRELRALFKHALLIMLNSSNCEQAAKAIDYWLMEKPRQRIRLGLLKHGIYINVGKKVIELFKKYHYRIAEYFCSGKKSGLRLMNKDAKIALSIVKYFTERGIPILAIHDSFIVQKKYRNLLFKVMQKQYAIHTRTKANPNGFRIHIK